MASNTKPQLLGCLLLRFSLLTLAVVSSISASSSWDDDGDVPPTVYEILPKFGLPSGLLPDSVKSYTLSAEGSFVVELEKPCYVQFDYLVYYERRITGTLKYGSITHLEGIQVQRFFIWFDVDEIRVDLPPSNNIYFQVGLINKKLDLTQFKTVHSCRDKASSSVSRDAPFLSWKQALELPSPVDEIQMLITE